MNFGELIETYSRWNFTQNTFFGKIRVLFSLEKYSVDEILELFKYLSNRSPIWQNFRPKMARFWVFLCEIDWNLTEFAKVPRVGMKKYFIMEIQTSGKNWCCLKKVHILNIPPNGKMGTFDR